LLNGARGQFPRHDLERAYKILPFSLSQANKKTCWTLKIVDINYKNIMYVKEGSSGIHFECSAYNQGPQNFPKSIRQHANSPKTM
jgi:hypothetical protein